jgi:gluconate 2-dehydrogenase gamma chain
MSERESALRLTRREILKLAGGAAGMAPLAAHLGAHPAAAAAIAIQGGAAAPSFFTAAEFRLLDELCEIIIPTDEHSPGARAAEVAGYIDRRLTEYDPSIPDLKDARDEWKTGLSAVEGLSREMHGSAFMDASEEKRLAVLERMAAKESSPETPAEKFFGRLKEWTARGYYTSKIGIHQEMEYKGNVLQPEEYAGADAAKV